MKNKMKKLVVAVMTMAMVVGCIPTTQVDAAPSKKKIKAVYAERIQQCKNNFPETAYFMIKDIDTDGVPELILYWDYETKSSLSFSGSVFSRSMLIYAYKDGKTKLIAAGDDMITYVGVYFKNSIIEKYDRAASDMYSSKYFKYSNGKKGTPIATDVRDCEKYTYIWKGKKVSQNEYERKLGKLTGGKEKVTFYKVTAANIKRYCK